MTDEINKSLSESNLTELQMNITPPNFASVRNKRKRDDECTKQDFMDFKEEIGKMITSLLSPQQQEIKSITSTLKEIQKTDINIEKSVAFLTEQNEEFRKKIEQLEKQAKDDKRYITSLEDKIEDLQKGIRKANFEMKNVPKKHNETKEDLVEMVMFLSQSVGCSIGKENIKDIYRVRGNREGAQNTPIVVETSSTLIKTDILKSCKAFNMKHKNKLCAKHLGYRTSEETPIFISEQLTAKGSRLYFLARDLTKKNAYKFCWTSYGKVYVRKTENSPIITIKCEAQVNELLQDTT